MRVAVWLLLAGMASAELLNIKHKSRKVDNPIDSLVRIINNLLPVLRDFLTAVFGNINKSSFRSVLAVASNLAAGLTSQRHLPRVPERWWGDSHHEDSTIRPFRVQFSHDMVSDLRARIHRRRNVTRSLRGAAHTYGTNSDYLNHFLDYWADGYDFQRREDWLNRFPQYITNIQGLNIHYIHVKPPNPRGKKVLPLLLLHGWPVSAFEYVHVIEHLLQKREDCDFVFEMIVPDLPGYGYSEGTNEIGLSQYHMATMMKNLMQRLGRRQFYVHAGDIGQFVADAMAVLYHDRVLGLHTNFAFSMRPQTLLKYVLGQLQPTAVTRHQDRMYPLLERALFYLENSGYAHLHATRPDNVGHGLEDSPVAQASWLLQNIILATSARNLLAVDGNLPRHYHMQDWFDSFTVYWASQCMVTAIRSYAEIFAWLQDPLALTILTTPTPVPFAAIRFRHELIFQPDDFLRDKYPNLLQATTLDFGGHFAGYEQPAVLADSIWTAVKKMEEFNEKHDVTEDLLV